MSEEKKTATIEERIEARIDSGVTGELAVSGNAGGLDFANATQAMEFAKLMAISAIAVPKHLRGNPGACLGVVVQAIEWRMSPYFVANKSYSVNDRLAYESQLIQAVILSRAPIRGRFKVEFKGEGEKRICHIWANLSNADETVDYESPEFGKITPKNSPLWKSDPDQQHFYYSARALCRRHFPDILGGVFTREEAEGIGPEHARDITPAPKGLVNKLDAIANGKTAEQAGQKTDDVPASEDASDGAQGTESTATASLTQDSESPAPPAEEENEDPKAKAIRLGKEAARKGLARRAIPVEYAASKSPTLNDCYLSGYDAEKEAMKEGAEG